MADQNLPHIFLADRAEPAGYTKKGQPIKSKIPNDRTRESHVKFLERKFDVAWGESKARKEDRSVIALPTRTGTYLEFESSPGYELPVKSLENKRADIRLLNVREEFVPLEEEPVVKATVYVPAGQEKVFLKKLEEYADPKKDGKNFPKNAPLLDSINDVKLALLHSLWRDDPNLMPTDEPAWCEVWLRGNEEEFRAVAEAAKIPVQEGTLRFPERTIVLVKANRDGLRELMDSFDYLAEFRLAKETASFWLALENADQDEWVKNLLGRLDVDAESKVAVCILDTGVNNGHQLLEPILADEDCHTVKPEWETHDHNPQGHGTLMCGLAGYGDLQQLLESDDPIRVFHKLESVKILPPGSDDPNKPELYGWTTSQAVSRVEIQAPDREHLMCMAVASTDDRDRGRPSSWSAAVDAITSGADDGYKRLFIVTAGNVEDMVDWRAYPDSNLTNSVHDPGQSWNALTVGAYTEKTIVQDPEYAGYKPIAKSGSLSPFSTTSRDWEGTKWPTKPDIVMEGGYLLKDPTELCTICDDTSLLSLSHTPTKKQFEAFYATSAATAQAGWLAAQIQAQYPHAWPETVRGLMIHSAEWTEAMKEDFLDGKKKGDYARLMRTCGYGVPSLYKALYCASNSLTLIAQETLQPFDKKKGGGNCTKDMHLFELPWPKDVLMGLEETDVTLKITLSYFIEPSPGEVGWTDRYRYPSHTLRFALNNPGEPKTQFMKRLSTQALDEGEKAETKEDTDRWTIGTNQRHLGSVHTDTWTGNATDLAACNIIGIYPVVGWWRGRPWIGKLQSKARYSLIVSLHAPEQHFEREIDIYTPVANEIAIKIS